MSISRLRRRRAKAAPTLTLPRKRGREGEGANGGYVLPPTVSCAALVGSDRRFRALVNDLFTIAARMEMVRTHLGARMGITGPQYSVLLAVAHLQGERGVSVGTVAQALHVSSAFIASETGKLARRRLLLKRPKAEDRRSMLLSLAPAGRLEIDRIGAELRAINDLFFGELDGASFGALCAAAEALVQGSERAVRYVAAVGGQGSEVSGQVSGNRGQKSAISSVPAAALSDY
jgi:MarR family transcriptional regulator, organic hydroperoxide resistance regulator